MIARFDLLGGMMRNLSWMLLLLLTVSLWAVEGDEVENQEPVLEEKIVWEKDGSEMMLIPAGSFEMGDSKNEPENWMKRSRPVHRVELNAFYMDVREVTVGQFREFVNQSGYKYSGNWAKFREFVNQSGYKYGGNWNDVAKYSTGDEYPMVLVNWNDATAYAEWAGKRLPTEAEWEYAARGGLVGKRYPWGDEITHDDANYAGTGGKDKWSQCSPVGSFEANSYGLYDVAGNVWEWCADWYGFDYYSKSPAKNPPGPDIGSSRVLRGGSWSNYTYYLRVAYRGYYFPHNRIDGLGFRCVSGLN